MYTRHIFVFGSNTKGLHKAGAALCALQEHGALMGCPIGHMNNCYAIVTKDLLKGKRSVPLSYIENQVLEFYHFAKGHPDWQFNVTAIGCGLAGFTPEEIAPMFRVMPENVKLPDEFTRVLEGVR